tara:strand:+ start:90 stop:368 length:279 start_codon:yes stop_codon:yes gene_type:complete
LYDLGKQRGNVPNPFPNGSQDCSNTQKLKLKRNRLRNKNNKTMDKHKQISAKGGSAGKGEAKRRTPEHYAEMNRKRWDSYRARKQAEKEAEQ